MVLMVETRLVTMNGGGVSRTEMMAVVGSREKHDLK